MSEIDEAFSALEDRDWSNAELVDDQPRRITVVHSVRMSHELSDRLLAEAHRRGATPSEVIRDLVEAGLGTTEDSATVRLADVHRVIDALVRSAA